MRHTIVPHETPDGVRFAPKCDPAMSLNPVDVQENSKRAQACWKCGKRDERVG